MYLAENLREYRKKLGLTQEEVAQAIQISPQSVSKWERGESLPDVSLLPSLANLLEISVDRLLGMERINDDQTRNKIFATANQQLRAGKPASAVETLSEGLRLFPKDGALRCELAYALFFANRGNLPHAIQLCEEALQGPLSEKCRHTARAALCYLYWLADEREKACRSAASLPHRRECRVEVLENFRREPSPEEGATLLRTIVLGES